MAAYALVAAILVVLAICHDTSSAHARVLMLPSPAVAKEFVEAHNQARAAVGVGPLKWSEQLATASSRVVRYQKNKKGCETADLNGNKYGRNQMSWRGGAPPTPRMVVDEWVEENKYYNYGTDSCAPNHTCGLYTQVVWNTSLELGCAQATCYDVNDYITLTICFYNPPGNYPGERPY